MADPGQRDSRDFIKTYRYLRIGMIGAVVLLGASIALEQSKLECWQTSISAYYYTPVRAIFVGAMIAVGLSLIVYKGRPPWEDSWLNLAGMLAPIVAVAPTTDVGTCWSVAPNPLPVNEDGSLAEWVVTNIANNIAALLVAGAIGLVVAALLAVLVRQGILGESQQIDPRTAVGLGITAAVLLAVWLLSLYWTSFNTRAHGFAAIAMFVFLAFAVITEALHHREDANRRLFVTYLTIAILMVVGALIIWLTRVFQDHTVFALEAYEITLFAVYWLVQTAEKWDEDVAV